MSVIDPATGSSSSTTAAATSAGNQLHRRALGTRDLVFFLSLIGYALFATGIIIRGHRAG